jgi:hypothetical protein
MCSVTTFKTAMKHHRWLPLPAHLCGLALAVCLTPICLTPADATEAKQQQPPPSKQSPHATVAPPRAQAGSPSQLRLPNAFNNPAAPRQMSAPKTPVLQNRFPPRQAVGKAWSVNAVPVARRISVCASAPRAAGCAIWGRFQTKADSSRLNESRSQILASPSGSTVTTWVGSDGAVRRVAMIASPPQTMSVTFIAAAAIPVIAMQAAVVPIALHPSASSPSTTPQNYYQGSPRVTPGGATPETLEAAGESDPIAVSTTVAPSRAATAPSDDQTTKESAALGNLAPSASRSGSSIPSAPPYSLNASSETLSVRAVCRRVTTVATVANDSDNATELWCRDGNGDWAMATDVTRVGS